jgi:hypothetical protein
VTGRELAALLGSVGVWTFALERRPVREETEALAELDSWLVSMAYFDPSDEAAEMPKYEFTYDLHANGVSTSMFLDYGDFALRAELSSIEFLDAASCE